VLSRRPEPSARVEQIRAETFDRQRARLLLRCAIDNPGAAMTVHAARFEVLLDGRGFATGETRLRTGVAADETAFVEVPVELAFLNLPRQLRERVGRGEPIPLVVRGALQALRAGEALAIEFDGETEIALAPEDRLD
jgi:hypothetical protein